MEIDIAEKRILEETREWNRWLDDHMPLALRAHLGERYHGILIDLLRHFHHSGGSANNVYGDGAIIVVDNEQRLLEQLENMVRYNIRRTSLKSFEGETPEGPQELMVAHFDFATSTDTTPTGLEDKGLLQSIYKAALQLDKALTQDVVDQQLQSLDRAFLLEASPSFIARNLQISHQCDLDLNVKAEVVISPNAEGQLCISMANRRSSPTDFFRNILRVIRSHGFSIEGIKTIDLPSSHHDAKLMNLFYLKEPKTPALKRENLRGRLLEAIAVAQWFEFETPFNQRFLEQNFSLHHTIFLRSVEEFLHQMLIHVNENLFSPATINEAFTRHPDVAQAIVSYFSARFNPVHRKTITELDAKEEGIRQMIDALDSGIPANDQRRQVILTLALEFVLHIQKTNYYVIRRMALSYRIDPAIMDLVPFEDRQSIFPELPFAIFFIKGKNFIAFNIRFRDLARGGVRTLLTLDKEKRDLQHREVFKECYYLAHTQQKKNKDIPEGGSKSVIFVKNYESFERDLESDRRVLSKSCPSKEALSNALDDARHTVIRRQLFDAQKAFCDSLLDILVWDAKKDRLLNEVIHDQYGKEELVFLGPDENMLDQMIDWLSTRSEERGYRVGTAFMSGKKGAGINHKAYGVTSLGVHEYLKACLEARGLNGRTFSVKVSGGPDGDVAGNELMNLVKDFSRKVKIKSIQDGTGLLYDPEGIHQSEIKRLFNNGLGVANMNPAKLHEGGFLLLIHQRREKSAGVEEILCLQGKKNSKSKLQAEENWIGASEANRMYSRYLLQLETDVFLPCGGRPRTLNAQNVGRFLNEAGEPSSQIIVEGANLFLDEGARLALEEKGALIIKDASANKCGVICSSYEIMAGLVTNNEEFGEIKSTLVEQVLAILIKKARREAMLLVRDEEAGSVIGHSDSISKAINHWTDQIMRELPELRKTKVYRKILKAVLQESVPEVLIQSFGKRIEKQPPLYLEALIASTMASTLIYHHGIDYQPSLTASLLSELDQGLFRKV